jgi:uncharacterized membrane protein YkoI
MPFGGRRMSGSLSSLHGQFRAFRYTGRDRGGRASPQPGRSPRHHPLTVEEIPMRAGRVTWGTWGLAAAVLVLMAAVARAEDEPKDLDKIPKAVMDALKAKFPRAKIDKWTKETENGKVVYDIEFKQDGRKAEADIAEDGTILNFEKEFDAKDLPKAVTDAVEKKYPKAKMKEVMEITEIKDKKEVHGGFEIVLETADKKEVEVTVAKDGKILEDSGAKKEGKK